MRRSTTLLVDWENLRKQLRSMGCTAGPQLVLEALLDACKSLKAPVQQVRLIFPERTELRSDLLLLRHRPHGPRIATEGCEFGRQVADVRLFAHLADAFYEQPGVDLVAVSGDTHIALTVNHYADKRRSGREIGLIHCSVDPNDTQTKASRYGGSVLSAVERVVGEPLRPDRVRPFTRWDLAAASLESLATDDPGKQPRTGLDAVRKKLLSKPTGASWRWLPHDEHGWADAEAIDEVVAAIWAHKDDRAPPPPGLQAWGRPLGLCTARGIASARLGEVGLGGEVDALVEALLTAGILRAEVRGGYQVIGSWRGGVLTPLRSAVLRLARLPAGRGRPDRVDREALRKRHEERFPRTAEPDAAPSIATRLDAKCLEDSWTALWRGLRRSELGIEVRTARLRLADSRWSVPVARAVEGGRRALDALPDGVERAEATQLISAAGLHWPDNWMRALLDAGLLRLENATNRLRREAFTLVPAPAEMA